MKQVLLRYLIPMLAAIIVGLAYTSSQSFWIDEGGTAFRAMMPTLAEWWKMIVHLKGSDIQMPVYMLYAWFWHQHLGAMSEYALRLSNLPWLVITVLALSRVRFWPLVCLISPFVLYFMDEFRPYSMQIAAGTCAAAAFRKMMGSRDENGTEGAHAICGACLFLIMCSLTSAIWAAGVALGALVIRPDWLHKREFWRKAAPWLAASLAAAGFYGFTMMKGFRAVETQDAGILNVMFGIYEMTGLLGLGPGKEELRGKMTAILPHLLVLIPATACITGAWLCGFTSWARSSTGRMISGSACAVILPMLALTIIGIVMEFRVLGRHLSPAIPAVLLPIAFSLQATGRMRKLSVALGIFACFLMLASSLGIKFLERHAKNDFRTATALAIAALDEGKRVWWQADMNTARYYAYRKGGFPMVNRIQVLESDLPSGPMFADIIFIDRPDLRYRGVDHRIILERNFFKLNRKLPGFEVWIAD